MSEKTATERLRELLDERGVEWWKPVQMEGSEYTRWHDANGMEWTTSEIHGSRKLRIGASFITPEQAIDATLGNEGLERSKNGVAERGTCHDTGGTDENGQQVFNCDACGCVLSLYNRDGTITMCTNFIYDYPRYCPACGREVVPE